MNSKMIKFYSEVVNCKNSKEMCPGIIKDVKKGCPPRGFYTQGVPGDIAIMVVGKNPGHVLDNERSMYIGESSEGIVRKQFNLIGSIFESTYKGASGDSRSLRFQKNLLRYLAYFLDIQKENVFKKCALTNLVKCSTVGEQDKLSRAAISQCYQKYLRKEIDYLKPRVILALGREVEQSLLKMGVDHPVIYIKHPSYFYRKDIEKQELDKIKLQIKKFLLKKS